MISSLPGPCMHVLTDGSWLMDTTRKKDSAHMAQERQVLNVGSFHRGPFPMRGRPSMWHKKRVLSLFLACNHVSHKREGRNLATKKHTDFWTLVWKSVLQTKC